MRFRPDVAAAAAAALFVPDEVRRILVPATGAAPAPPGWSSFDLADVLDSPAERGAKAARPALEVASVAESRRDPELALAGAGAAAAAGGTGACAMTRSHTVQYASISKAYVSPMAPAGEADEEERAGPGARRLG